jgi:hypothetical protein
VLTRGAQAIASALMRHSAQAGCTGQVQMWPDWPAVIPGMQACTEPTKGRRGMILSVLVTLAFVATLLWMLLRAFTGPMHHRHRRAVH